MASPGPRKTVQAYCLRPPRSSCSVLEASRSAPERPGASWKPPRTFQSVLERPRSLQECRRAPFRTMHLSIQRAPGTLQKTIFVDQALPDSLQKTSFVDPASPSLSQWLPGVQERSGKAPHVLDSAFQEPVASQICGTSPRRLADSLSNALEIKHNSQEPQGSHWYQRLPPSKHHSAHD